MPKIIKKKKVLKQKQKQKQTTNVNITIDQSKRTKRTGTSQQQKQQQAQTQYIPMPQPQPQYYPPPRYIDRPVFQPQIQQPQSVMGVVDAIKQEEAKPVLMGVPRNNEFLSELENQLASTHKGLKPPRIPESVNPDEFGIEMQPIPKQYNSTGVNTMGLKVPTAEIATDVMGLQAGNDVGVNTEQVNVLTKPPVKAFPLDKPELSKAKSAPLESTTSTQPVVATVRQEEERLSDDMRLYQRIGGDVDEYNQIESKFRPSKWKSAVTQYYNAKILPNTEYNNFTEYIKANFDGRNPKQIGVEDYRQLARNAFK